MDDLNSQEKFVNTESFEKRKRFEIILRNLELAKQRDTLEAITNTASFLKDLHLPEQELIAIELSIEDIVRQLSLNPKAGIDHSDKWKYDYLDDVRPSLSEDSKYRLWGDALIELYAAGYEKF